MAYISHGHHHTAGRHVDLDRLRHVGLVAITVIFMIPAGLIALPFVLVSDLKLKSGPYWD